MSKVLSGLQLTYDKLLTRCKVPVSARTSRITPAHFPSIILLHLSTFDDARAEVALRLSGASRIVNYCRQTSTLLLLGDEVVGVTLVLSKKNQNLVYVYAVMLKPKWHHTWAAVYLKYHSFVRLLSAGFDKVAFQALEGNRDTLSHAEKVGAKTVVDDYVWGD